MKYLRYYSEFYDTDHNLYRVEILQEAEQAFTPQEVELTTNSVTLEWGEVDKLEPVMSSSATLSLISMVDRQFIDLYTVETCAIRMDVYRNGSIYWSGTLDPELFEEPFSMADRYVTECTFSDFAVLSRLTWEKKGVMTLREIITECLSMSEVKFSSINEVISTTIPDVGGSILDNCSLSLENFFDEDGTAWSAREVLDEVLRPFALRLTQKNGIVNIADINALMSTLPEGVKWLNADAKLGVEPTYNRIIVTFSPYSDATVYDGSFSSENILPNVGAAGVGQMAVPMPETDFNGFNFYYSNPYAALTLFQNTFVGGTARLFRIKPDNDGQESVGVMWGVRPSGESWTGNAPLATTYQNMGESVIMESPRIPVVLGGSDYRLKISLDVMFDVRKNPFEDATIENEKGNWEDFEDWANYGVIPCELVLYGYDGKVYKVDNRMYHTNSWRAQWFECEESSSEYRLMLEYYDEGNRKSATGFGGWTSNKQNIGFTDNDLGKSITLNIEGEKIPLPPKAGELVFRVYSGVLLRDNADIYNDATGKVINIARWLLYKDPKITIAQVSGKDIEAEDIEISAWINKAAEEELPIDTYIGCATDRTPLARGSIMLSSTYEPIQSFSRAGITDRIEKLLIGTAYSNFAERKNTLSGSIKLIPAYSILSDVSFVSSRFLVLSEMQNLQAATAEIKMAEIGADNYENIEYEAV